MITLETMLECRPVLANYAGRLTTTPEDAEDLVQETYERAWKARTQFDGDNPAGWLAIIMRNKHLAKRSRARSVPATAFADLPTGSAEDEAEQTGVHAVLQSHTVSGGAYECVLAAQAFARLTDSEHQLITASIAGKSYEQLAAELDVAIGTIRSRLSRARGKLSEFL
jgi:RNA polymerase sigma-70 factor (ECF subfamily)